MTRTLRAATLLALSALVFPTAARATPLVWDIDATKSKITLSIPDQTVVLDGIAATLRVRNQTAGGTSWNTGNTASLDGFLNTNFTFGSTIGFTGQASGDAFALNSGNYRPNPAAFNSANTNADNPDGRYSNATLAPAVFGGRTVGVLLSTTSDIGYLAFSNVSYNATSGTLPLAGSAFGTQTFNAAGLDFGILSALFSFDGIALPLGAGQPLTDTNLQPVGPVIGDNSATNGTIENLLSQLRLTIPIDVPASISIGGVPVNVTLTGTIVAYAAPEPSSFALAGIGTCALAVWGKQWRTRHVRAA